MRDRKLNFLILKKKRKLKKKVSTKKNYIKKKMVVLEATLGSSLLGGHYAQSAPALKMLQKRYLGLHQWLGPVCTKELKEQIVS